MTTKIQVFINPLFGEIRTAKSEAGDPIFCLSDICGVLELQSSAVARRLEKDVISSHPLVTAGGTQMANFVNEDGLYDVILDSRKPEAKAFRKWVTSEVLPTIRKSGGYMVTRPDETPEQIMARALKIADDTIKRQAEQIEKQAPKVLFATAVETSNRSVLVAELAKIITQNGYEIGQNRLFTWLRNHGYLGRMGEYYNQPTQRAMGLGLFELKKTTITKPDGTTLVSTTSKVTGKGQIYFVNKFLRNKQEDN